ncbi:MAG: hypothetical protein A2821_03735 [Candidatus Magasanikbacteria bacterium RIFCSPHIGHO2_01_FULL_41_23]|nr:MAG: hypothetical protein A2821_03735 [Candidatus Magasanikbacteria bacterium RIFCSPHIGHO2_01_FULL_41_23]
MPKDLSKKSNIAIWKIDTSIDNFLGKSADEALDMIKASYTKRKLDVLELKNDSYEGKKVKVFHTERFSDGWSQFLRTLLPDSLTDEKKQKIFHGINKDLILFVYDDKNIFAITSGAGYFIIQNYIDERFPFEVAKRMLTGGFKSAEMRDLTGLIYSQSRNFRRNYNFSRREAFGKVWKKLTGKVDSGVLKNSEFIADFISEDGKKTFNADIKSSFTFRKTVSLDDVLSVMKEIEQLLVKNPTDDQKRAFSFLDTLKEITNKKVKEKLRDALLNKLYEFIASTNNDSDFDFCHSKEMVTFLHGGLFKIADGLSWDQAPSASDVLIKLRDAGIKFIDKSDFVKFKESFLKLSLSFTGDDEDGLPFTDDLWKYFHGEIDLNGKKYFFIDGKWYEVVGDFLKRLAEDFQEEVFGEKAILISDIPFISWGVQDEGEFNKAQAKESGFYIGDKIFLKQSEKGKIELFDLIFTKDDRTYLIQVKDGFGASIRDACSQVQMAAEIIENSLVSNNNSELESYYEEFNKSNTGVSKNEFFKLLKKNRQYVLAFSTKDAFTKANFLAKKFQSEIARFEVLGLSHEFRANVRQFQIAHIKKS